MNWETTPFDHAGRWYKKYDSIMNPPEKVTWPQLMAEYVIYWRTRFLKDYQNVKVGPNWYKNCSKQVRDLNMQSSVICNYFPHPDDEPLIVPAIKNYFRNFKPMKIGQFRKVRVTQSGKINITQDEKDVVLGIQSEFDRLLQQRKILSAVVSQPTNEDSKNITFDTKTNNTKKSSISKLIDLENQIKSRQ